MAKTEIRHVVMQSHMNMAKGNTLVQHGEIHCPKHEHHGKKVEVVVFTPKNKKGDYGKPDYTFTCNSVSKRKFKKLESLIKFLKLPELKEEKVKWD